MKSIRPHLADSGFALAILVFLTVGIISYVSALHLAEVRAEATHSFQVLEAIARLDSNVSQIAEEADRAVQAAEPQKFSTIYAQRVEQKNRIVERLHFLMEGDSEQQNRLNGAETLITRAYVETAKVMLARPQKPAEAGKPTAADTQAISLTEQIHAVLGELTERETQALESSLKKEVESAEFSRKVTTSATVGGLLVMIFVFVMLKRDISARQKAEDAFTIQHELLTGLISHIPESVYVKDAKGRFIMANHACRKSLTGKANGDVLGKTIFDFLSPHSANEVDLDDRAVIRSKSPFIDRTKRILNADGEYTWQLTSKVPLFDAVGELTELLGIQRDITEEIKLQEETKKAQAPFILPATSELLAVASPQPEPAIAAFTRGNPVTSPPVANPPAQHAPHTRDGFVVKPLTDKELNQPMPTHPTDLNVEVSSFEDIVEMIGSADFAKMLINIFLDETPKTLKELEEATVAGDREKMGRAAHTLKGSLGNFGAKKAMELAHVLEFKEESGEPVDVGKSFEEFRSEVLRVMLTLSSYV
jgi:PAS domain S-box-containing protein